MNVNNHDPSEPHQPFFITRDAYPHGQPQLTIDAQPSQQIPSQSVELASHQSIPTPINPYPHLQFPQVLLAHPQQQQVFYSMAPQLMSYHVISPDSKDENSKGPNPIGHHHPHGRPPPHHRPPPTAIRAIPINAPIAAPSVIRVICHNQSTQTEGTSNSVGGRGEEEAGYLDEKVSIPELAAKTKNYSGAEIEGVVRSAVSYAFNELLDQDQIRQLDHRAFRDVRVTQEIFDLALSEVQPEYGAQDDDLRLRYSSGIYKFSPEVTEICDTAENIARRLRASPAINRYSLLLRGPLGSGKTALACYLAQLCDFPLVRVISPESFVGWSEGAVCQNIAKAFDDAYKSPASIVIIDDFERLINYIDSDVGPRFSNLILQALLTCLRRQPEVIDRKIFMVVTSTSDPIRMLKIEQFFDFARDMPMVSSPEQFRKLLEEAGLFSNCGSDVERIVESFSGSCGVKDVITVLELAQNEDGNITWESFRESWLSKFRGMGDESKLLMF